MKKIERIIFYSLFVLLMIILSFYDLEIMQNLYNPRNGYGRWLAAIGEMPFLWITAFGGWIAFRCRNKKTKGASIGWGITYGVLAFLASLYAGVMLYIYIGQLGYYDHSSGVREIWWLALIITCIFYLTSLGAAYLVDINNREEALTWGLVVIYIWISYVITMVVFKFLWYRPRYRYLVTPEAIAAGDKFLPWWHPNCHGKFSDRFASFPSGHTMNAVGIIVLASATNVFGKKKYNRYIMDCVAAIWGVMVAVSRIIQGAHFATDVTFGFFFGILNYDLIMTFAYPRILERNKKRLI